MESKQLCLNCKNEVSDQYCSVCGQRTSTHRYSLKHFFMHDLVHGIFHLDKGFLYTIKELLTRPGHSIREFIQGRRSQHFNYFTLLVIVLAVSHFLNSFSPVMIVDIMDTNNSQAQGLLMDYELFMRENPRLIALILIPFYALITYFLFKKSNQNFTENLVLNTYRTSAEFIIALVFILISIFIHDLKLLGSIFALVQLITLGYSFWFYKQYFSAFGYSQSALIARSTMSALAPMLIGAIIGGFIGIFIGVAA